LDDKELLPEIRPRTEYSYKKE